MWRMFKGDELVDIASEGGQTTLDGVTRQVRRRDSASYVARRAAARRPDGGRFQNLISGGVFYRSQVLRSLPGSDATVAISEVFHATGEVSYAIPECSVDYDTTCFSTEVGVTPKICQFEPNLGRFSAGETCTEHNHGTTV